MNELYTRLEEFIAAARERTAETANKAADVIDSISAWLRSLASGVMQTEAPVDDANLVELEEQLDELRHECETEAAAVKGKAKAAPDPKKIDPATILMIVQLVTALIEAWRKRRNP